MTGRSVQHDTIVVERSFDASPKRVFAAWVDPRARRRWTSSVRDGSSAPSTPISAWAAARPAASGQTVGPSSLRTVSIRTSSPTGGCSLAAP
jgi:uncharacterized protein YndB with AHSA1/START domain